MEGEGEARRSPETKRGDSPILDPNAKRTLVHVGPTMGGALTCDTITD